MKVKELKDALEKLIEDNPIYSDWSVAIPVKIKDEMLLGPTPSLRISQISPGFDWDNKKVFLVTDKDIKMIYKDYRNDK